MASLRFDLVKSFLAQAFRVHGSVEVEYLHCENSLFGLILSQGF